MCMLSPTSTPLSRGLLMWTMIVASLVVHTPYRAQRGPPESEALRTPLAWGRFSQANSGEWGAFSYPPLGGDMIRPLAIHAPRVEYGRVQGPLLTCDAHYARDQVPEDQSRS